MPKPWGGSDDVDILQRRVLALEAKLGEARELLQAGLRYAWNCEGDPQQPSGFRARAEVWMADVRYLIGDTCT